MDTFQDIVDTVKGILDDYGLEYVYPINEDAQYPENPCEYVRGGEPSCLVGQVLFRKGMSIEDIEFLDTANAGIGIGLGAAYEKGWISIELDVRSRVLLDCLQTKQDNGMAWGPAFDYSLRFSQTVDL